MFNQHTLVSSLAFSSLYGLVAAQVQPAVPFSSGFNSSFSLSDDQIAAANLSETIVDSINAIVNFDRSSLANGGPREDEFYNLSSLSDPDPNHLEPGQVIRVQEVTNTTNFAIAPGSSLSRILYASQTYNGSIVPASAYVLWPHNLRKFNDQPTDKAAAVLWAHGTSGWFSDAAPSSHRGLYYEYMFPLSLIQAGYAIVAPDYAGLGVGQSWDGEDIPHQYNVASVGGHDTLYAMTAALEAFESRLSGQFAVAGHSQGGAVAWSVSELLGAVQDGESTKNAKFQDLLKSYVGTLTIAPVTKPFARPNFIMFPTAMIVHTIFPDFTLDTWLTPLAIARVKLFRDIQGSPAVAQQLFASEPLDTLLKPGWFNASYHGRAFEELANLGQKPMAGPVLLIQGTEDVFVDETITNKTVTDTVADLPETQIEYAVAEGHGHTPIITVFRSFWMDWLDARFRGEEVSPGLKRTSLHGWLEPDKYFIGSSSYSQWNGAPEYLYQNPGAV